MRKIGVYIILCIGVSGTALAQSKQPSVIAAAGDISKAGTIILEWTVGEPLIETVSSSSALLTQGFHQPLLEVVKLNSGKEYAVSKNNVRVYPNPVTAVINVQLDTITEETLMVSLLDAGGKVLLNKAFPANSSSLKINVVGLSQGTYHLRITNRSGALHGDYKIIKAQ